MQYIHDCPVAVFGGAGFLGSHLVDHLVEDRNCEVLVIDNLVIGHREWINPKARFIHHDITGSEDFTRKILKHHGAEYVFNYIAWPYIPDSFARPLHVFNVNATAAIKVINAAQEAGAEGILQVSSAEIYGDAGARRVEAAEHMGNADEIERLGGFRLCEDSPVLPHSTYGAAKAAVDYYCQTAWRERQTPVIALRQFNCCGERESHPYVIPEIIGQLAGPQNAEEARVRLGNNSFRDFQYAGDAVRMATELLERSEYGEVYNMGGEGGVKIYELAESLGRLMGFPRTRVDRDLERVRPWEIWHLQSDNSKLYSVIEGRPRTSLEDALRLTIAWYRENGSRWPWENREVASQVR